MIVAGFSGPDTLMDAVRRLRAAGVEVETRTPCALPPDEDSPPSTRIPLIVLLAGLGMGGAAFAMQCWATMRSYPLIIGGRPDFFWTGFLVYSIEVGVLAAVATAFLSFMVASRLPRLWEPSDEDPALREATRDGWFLVVQGPPDPARAVLRTLDARYFGETDA